MPALHQHNQPTMTDLINQIGEWSTRNFQQKQASDLGIVEEIGEICHCILKRLQGIRGFTNDERYREHLKDGFADLGIFTLNYAGVNGILIYQDAKLELLDPSTFDYRSYLCQLLMAAADLVRFTSAHGSIVLEEKRPELQTLLQRIWTQTHLFAMYYEINFYEEVLATWAKVRLRDWEKNPTSAHTGLD